MRGHVRNEYNSRENYKNIYRSNNREIDRRFLNTPKRNKRNHRILPEEEKAPIHNKKTPRTTENNIRMTV